MGGDWKAVVDPKSGKTYYYNKATRETKWKLPEGAELTDSAAASTEPIKRDDQTHNPVQVAEDNPKQENAPKLQVNVENKVPKTSPTVSDEAPVRGSPLALQKHSPAVESTIVHENPLLNNAKLSGASAPKTKAKARELLDGTTEDEVPLPGDEMLKKLMEKFDEDKSLGDPNEWRKAVDPRNGRTYYWNIITKHLSYNRPLGFQDDEVRKHVRSSSGRILAEEKGDEESDLVTSANERRIQALQQTSSRHSRGKSSGTFDMLGRHSRQKSTASDSSRDDDKDDEDLEEEEEENEEPEIEIKADTINFQFTHHRKGLMNRVFHLGSSIDKQSLLSFKKSLIRKSILKENRPKDALMIQCFKSIMSFMGDRKSIKAAPNHAKRLIGNALGNHQSVRDEVFLQICKQCNGHPNPKNCLKGYELLTLVLAAFPPSSSMRQYLISQLQGVLSDNTADNAIKDKVAVCLDRLSKIFQMGQRTETPSLAEIKQDMEGTPYTLKVYILDKTFTTMDVDPFTLIRDVKQFMINRLGIIYSSIFGLYEFNRHGDERSLEEKQRAVDVISIWEKLIKENNIKQAEPFRMVFKATVVLKTTFTRVLGDDEAIKLLYVQAVHDIVSERYPADVKSVPSVIALHLITVFGNYDPAKHTLEWLEERCQEFFPSAVLAYYHKRKAAALKEAAQKLLAKYSKLTGISAPEARLSFLDYVQDWPLYGACIIHAEQDSYKDLPPMIRIAVTCDGVHLVHPKTRDIVESWNWSEIISWGASPTKFVIQVGDLIIQKKFQFNTNKGELFMKVLDAYVNERSKQ